MSNARVTTTPVDFLAALHPPDGAGFIDLRALPSKAQAFVRPGDIEAAESFIRANAGENLYFGVAARKSHINGTLENCGLLFSLFVDVDFTKISELEARAKITRFPLPPSIIILSGGGLHVYYLLREPIDLQAPAEAERAKSLLRRLARALGGDLSAAEPARILRVPDTWNYKYTPARPVTIEAFNA